ncbi:MAG: response regulator [Deltaproteobacteria bacterium]|nr:response regulator [Deltaproteobacteria bacterium]
MASKSKRILVVDDDEFIRECCFELLALKGYEVDLASNGIEAISKIGSSNYDLVITDVNMPRLDGIGLYLAVLRDYPFLKDSFVFISGNVTVENEAGAILKKMSQRVLKKPFRVDELLESVSQIVNRPDNGGGRGAKRREERFSLPADCELMLNGRALTARILDISISGLKLRYRGEPLDIDAGAGVYIECPEFRRRGHIKWSKSDDGSAISGVQLTEPLPVTEVMELASGRIC